MIRRRLLLPLLLAPLLVMTLFVGPVSAADDLDHRLSILRATLTGAAEIPGPGDSDGRGGAHVVLLKERGRICYEVHVRNIGAPTAAHIHVGPADVAGPVVVNLLPAGARFRNGLLVRCVDVAADLIDQIDANPAGYYVNVHNADFPSGAIRGQLAEVDI
jgi:hypothetical protein